MKFISWNVNGLRACYEKSLRGFLQSSNADIFCMQETKLQEPFPLIEDAGYYVYWSFASRKGYSGVCCLSKEKPLDVTYGIGENRFDEEGRVITLVFKDHFFVNSYTPNSKGSMERYFFRMDWDEAFRGYISRLLREKPVIICGDFNVAHNMIDTYPENLLNQDAPPGFRAEERDGMDQLLGLGLIDSFRYLHPNLERAYSWWSNRLNKRDENRGWRLDYFLISSCFKGKIRGAGMYSDILGSDHCPIYLELEV